MRWHPTQLPFPLLLFLSSLLFVIPVSGTKDLRVCAYNVQKLNKEKASNPRMMHTLMRTLARCDIALLQEVMDQDGSVVKKLLEALNRVTDRYENYNYKAASSQSMGKSPSDMQQYVFLYRTETVSLMAEHQYMDKNKFVRSPFAVKFKGKKTKISDFVLVALHADSKNAVKEIDGLYDVFQEVSKKWNTKNVMFLGDFQAGCAYMTRHDRKKIRLFTEPNFFWLIGDKVDTTVTDETNCAYDRIVVHSEPFLKGIRALSANVFNVGREFKLSRSTVRDVSDHLPVEVLLKGSASLLQATPLLLLLSISTLLKFLL